MANETLHINGVTYEVTKEITPETATPVQRDMMLERGQSRFLFMRRPKGRVTYHVVEYAAASGARVYSETVSMGEWS